MKIVAGACMLNEAYNVTDFCRNFSFADEIVLSDGGSTDNSVELAEKFDNVTVYHFNQRVTLSDGSFMNPEGPHHNFLLDKAEEHHPDWIVYQALDHRLNEKLRQDIRSLLADNQTDSLHTRMVYVFKKKHYLTGMGTKPFCLAWKNYLPVRMIEDKGPFHCEFDRIPEPNEGLVVGKPYCVLHHTWPTEKVIKEKMRRYALWGRPMPNRPDKEPQWGKLKRLEDWML